MPMRGETPFDSTFVVNGCKIIWCARVKGGIVAKLLKSGTVFLRDICWRDKQGTISSHKNWLNKKETKSLSFNYPPERSETEKHVWNNKINSSHLLRMKTGEGKKGEASIKNREIQDEPVVLQPQLGKAVLSEISGCPTRDLLVKSHSSKFLIKQSNQPWTQVLQWHSSYTSLLICFTWTPNGSLLNTSSCWIMGWGSLSWSFPRSFFSPAGLGIKKGKFWLVVHLACIPLSMETKYQKGKNRTFFSDPDIWYWCKKGKELQCFRPKARSFFIFPMI